LLRRHARKIGVFVVGWLIVIVGLLLVPLPGPGWAIVFVGLSLLSTEFAWAARLKNRVQQWLSAWVHKVQARRAQRRQRRRGFVDGVVEEVLEDVEIVAAPRGQHQPPAGNRPDVL
jgi:uncharacterized protein (TIGR02611 family)